MAEPRIKLSTRDKNIKRSLQLSPDELLLDELGNQSDTSMQELMRTIISTPEGVNKKGVNRKQILETELSRIKESMAPIGLGIGATQVKNNSNNTTATIPPSQSPLDQVKDFLINMWSLK